MVMMSPLPLTSRGAVLDIAKRLNQHREHKLQNLRRTIKGSFELELNLRRALKLPGKL